MWTRQASTLGERNVYAKLHLLRRLAMLHTSHLIEDNARADKTKNARACMLVMFCCLFWKPLIGISWDALQRHKWSDETTQKSLASPYDNHSQIPSHAKPLAIRNPNA